MKLSIIFLLIFFSFTTSSEENVPEKPVETSLQQFFFGTDSYLTYNYKNVKGWHTYWKNPGDAGLATTIKVLNAPEGFEYIEMEWQAPSRYIESGQMWAFGYSNEYSRFLKIKKIPSESFSATFQSTWLVCKHICIPGRAEIEARFEGGRLISATPSDLKVSQEQLAQRFKTIPQIASQYPEHLDTILHYGAEENSLVLYYNMATPGTPDPRPYKYNSLLTPFPHPFISFKHEDLFYDKRGNIFGRLRIDWDGEYETPPIALPKDGVLKDPIKLSFIFLNPLDGTKTIVSKTFKSILPTQDQKMDDFFKLMTAIPATNPSSSEKIEIELKSELPASPLPNQNLWYFLLFGFLGGLILNIMPCVLPVISLKLFGLIQHSQESSKRILKHNLFYTFGVLTTFLILAIIILAIKSTGETIGWGFQLQSPHFVFVTIIVLFIMSLNLFGLFEFKTPGGKTLGGIELRDSYWGDFLSGIIATILSTPCSAPFLGTALTFAFTSSTVEIISVFMAIGVGLSFPFLLTGFFPSMIRFLPKPGMWMNKVKKLLGLTLILTIIWLMDVYAALTPTTIAVIKTNTILVLIFGFFFIKVKNKKIKLLMGAIPFVLALNVGLADLNMETSQDQKTALLNDKKSLGLPWEAWSEEKMKEYANQGSLVFMDFTAKWCFTCKVNERLVIETEDFKSLTDKYQVKLLLADWTKRDTVIGKFLEKNGLVGVPAYFVQLKDGRLISLGETITISEIEKALKTQ